MERDFLDNSAKARESQDCSQKVLELQKKFDFARAQVKKRLFYNTTIYGFYCNIRSDVKFYIDLQFQIKRLPGIDYNKQDQLKQFEILSTQLRLKRELLQKYRNMCSFETSFK